MRDPLAGQFPYPGPPAPRNEQGRRREPTTLLEEDGMRRVGSGQDRRRRLSRPMRARPPTAAAGTGTKTSVTAASTVAETS